MKFLPIFGVMLILTFLALLFFESVANVWFWIAAVAFVLSGLLYAFFHLDDRIQALEKRIQELEEKKVS